MFVFSSLSPLEECDEVEFSGDGTAGTYEVRLSSAGIEDCARVLEFLLCDEESKLSRRPVGVETFDRSSADLLSAPKLDSDRPACSIFPVFFTSLPRLIEGGACSRDSMIVKPAMQKHIHPATTKMTSLVLNNIFLLGSVGEFVPGLVGY